MASHSDCSLMMNKAVKILDLILLRIDNCLLLKSRSSSKRGRTGQKHEPVFSPTSISSGQLELEELPHKQNNLSSLAEAQHDENFPLIQTWHSEPIPQRYIGRNWSHQAAHSVQAYISQYKNPSHSYHNLYSAPSSSHTLESTVKQETPPHQLGTAGFNFALPASAPRFPVVPPWVLASSQRTAQDALLLTMPKALSAPLPAAHQQAQQDYFGIRATPQYEKLHPLELNRVQPLDLRRAEQLHSPAIQGTVPQSSARGDPRMPSPNALNPLRNFGIEAGAGAATLLDPIDWSKI